MVIGGVNAGVSGRSASSLPGRHGKYGRGGRDIDRKNHRWSLLQVLDSGGADVRILAFLVELDRATDHHVLVELCLLHGVHKSWARCCAGALVCISCNEQGFERETGIETVAGETIARIHLLE